jgi:hypothetical protein
VFSAAPIFYANSAEAALAAYVPNLKSLLGNEFVSEDLMLVVTGEGRVVFSNQPAIIGSGSIFELAAFHNSFIAQTSFGDVTLYSLKPNCFQEDRFKKPAYGAVVVLHGKVTHLQAKPTVGYLVEVVFKTSDGWIFVNPCNLNGNLKQI